MTKDEFADHLVTFVALSFYDTSTSDDHAALQSQLEEIGNILIQEMEATLLENNLEGILPNEYCKQILRKIIEFTSEHLEDPLWPMFKFPLSENEEIRLTNMLRGRMKMFRETCLSLRDNIGRVKQERQELSTRRIELTKGIQNVLPRIYPYVVQIRLPRYRNVSYICAGKMLTIRLGRNNYASAPKAKALSEALMYFYLGHRIPISN